MIKELKLGETLIVSASEDWRNKRVKNPKTGREVFVRSLPPELQEKYRSAKNSKPKSGVSSEENPDTGNSEYYFRDKEGNSLGFLNSTVEYDPSYKFEPYLEAGVNLSRFGINPDDPVVELEHLEVKPEHRGKGIAAKLILKFLKDAEEQHSDKNIILNASPYGSSDMDLDDLTKFYAQFGFETVHRFVEHKNALMVKRVKK